MNSHQPKTTERARRSWLKIGAAVLACLLAFPTLYVYTGHFDPGSESTIMVTMCVLWVAFVVSVAVAIAAGRNDTDPQEGDRALAVIGGICLLLALFATPYLGFMAMVHHYGNNCC